MPGSPRDAFARRRRLHAIAALAGLVLGASSVAAASFTSSVSVSHTMSSAVLQAPTSVAATNGTCVPLVSTRVNLLWTATTSTFADGYEVLRKAGSGSFTTIATVSGPATTTYTDTEVSFATAYVYVVQSTKSSWRSADSNEASVTTPSTLCL